MSILTGGKTYLGAALLAFSAIAPLLGISAELSHALQLMGEAIMGAGIGHKIQKASNKL
jgi:uncharacterized membrane protein AbrB (regulator of aidB expression)